MKVTDKRTNPAENIHLELGDIIETPDGRRRWIALCERGYSAILLHNGIAMSTWSSLEELRDFYFSYPWIDGAVLIKSSQIEVVLHNPGEKLE
jgi:hypothetical protein